jgi:hypothetical protein
MIDFARTAVAASQGYGIDEAGVAGSPRHAGHATIVPWASFSSSSSWR